MPHDSLHNHKNERPPQKMAGAHVYVSEICIFNRLFDTFLMHYCAAGANAEQ
jgi:hypothetical protein